MANYIEVSEETLRIAANIAGPNSSFQEVLFLGEDYKKVGLTPKYMADDSLKIIYVTTEEHKNFH